MDQHRESNSEDCHFHFRFYLRFPRELQLFILGTLKTCKNRELSSST